MPPDPTPRILDAGPARLTIDPAAGGRMASLVVHGHELLVTEGFGPIRWGCYPMAPFAGRIRDGRFTYQGAAVQLPRNLPPHAIHGTAFVRPWTVTGPDTLGTDLGPDWPFAGRVTQRVDLRADGLDVELRLDADVPMPATIGWHPWFRWTLTGTADRPRSPSGRAILTFQPGAMYERAADGLPTGRLVTPSPRPWDDCFTDVREAPAVSWPGGLSLRLTSSADHWVVYDESDDGLCIEPQTGPPDAVNLLVAAGRDATGAGPGAPLVATMAWRWARL